MQSQRTQELISTCNDRKALYEFLAAVYANEVTVDFLRQLRAKTGLLLDTADDPEIHGTEMAHGFKEISTYVSSLKERDLGSVRLDLAVEFARLFLGVGRMPFHPSESSYVTREHLVMQKPRDEVLKLYKAMGVTKVSGFAEPEDHVALELRFMAHLCEKVGAALLENDLPKAKRYFEIQRDFLNEHLGKWVPELAADVMRMAKNEFYKSVAKITKGYLEEDKKAVSEMIEAIDA
jgi:TorA maturation chaperone TorD